MGKATIFESPRVLVGLNAFEPGQEHALHAHAGQDKVYQVIEGDGLFLLDGRELAMKAGDLLVAPEGIAARRAQHRQRSSARARDPRARAAPMTGTSWTRLALVAGLAIWTIQFARTPLSADMSSFLHLPDLVFHEAGHIIFSPFGRFMTVLGGSCCNS